MTGFDSRDQLADMLAADGATTAPSVQGDLIRQQFEGDRRIGQREEVWVPGRGPFDTGHWETIGEIDAGTAPG